MRSSTFAVKKRKYQWKRMLPVYLMVIPGLVYMICNNYLPMFGIVIAFKKLNFAKGILDSPWVGLENFELLFKSSTAYTIIRNTVLYNVVFIILGTVVASYLFYALLTADTGMINNVILKPLGLAPVNWYMRKEFWPVILVLVNIWKGVGYQMIIYLSSIVSISPEYFEAATIDGATKWQQIRKITLPLLKPTVITLLIMSVGRIFASDFGLFNQVPRNSGALYETTQTIDVYVYNALMKNSNYGMSSAASVFQSVVGFVLVVTTNYIARRTNRESALF